MTTTDPDLAHMLVALDDGDDSVLPILADLWEEAGDPRAAGLRLIGDRQPLQGARSGWEWHATPPGYQACSAVGAEVLERLALDCVVSIEEVIAAGGVAYPTRIAALLALAAALGATPVA